MAEPFDRCSLGIDEDRGAGSLADATSPAERAPADTPQRPADRDLRRTREALEVAVLVARLGSWELEPGTGEFVASDRLKAQLGLAPDAPVTLDLFRSMQHPDDVERFDAATSRAVAQGAEYAVEYRVTRPDGSIGWLVDRGRVLRGDAGQPVRLIGMVLDITEQKEAEERQALLIRELHHRVKNTLATVQAIVGSTARTAADVNEFYRSFVGRIVSLGQMYTLLTEDVWQTAGLEELLRAELKPFDEPAGRVSVGGPPVELSSEAAVPMGMAFHELTTNAAKYGALSVPGGSVAVSWSIAALPEGEQLQLSWTESGGPSVGPPGRQGFGSKLLQRVLSAQLSADVTLDYDPSGLRFHLRAPLPKRSAAFMAPLA